ncbi:MAG: helix-turn-helix transcriptional regulator [Phycisphaerae bacterium]|nr:helix-turn-helix transcriptional regulator [Phycisphaerae bacterium]
MIHWAVNFQIFRPMASLPRAITVASETVSKPSYHHEGRYRRREETCLFKYTLAGEGVFRDAAGEHRIPAGCGFLCEIRDPATAYYYPAAASKPWSFVYMSITGAPAFEMVRELLHRYGPVYELPREDGVVAEMLSFADYHDARPRISPAFASRLAIRLLTELAESKEQPRQDNMGNRLAARAVEIIRETLHENMNVSELAERLRVSREHLTRIFKEQTSRTPRRYMLRQKMLLACRLLKTTQLTHKEIAVRLGYDAPAHFTRTFKHILGMTPGRFRAVGTIPMG